MFEVNVKSEPERAYESVKREVRSADIDRFIRESLAELEARYDPAGLPFAMYMGCDKDDAQLVEVCLPTDAGRNTLPPAEVAFTIARGEQCDYPEILTAYDAVAKFVEESGRSFGGPPRETYLGEAEMEIAFPLT